MPATPDTPASSRPSLPAALAAAWKHGRLSPSDPLPSWMGPVFHAARTFLDSHALVQASALAYTTVLSIVPFLAVAFSIAKGLGLYDAPPVRDALLRLTAGRTAVVDGILDYIQNTNVKTLGAVGTALLLVTAVSLLSTVEGAINTVWKVQTRRGPWIRFTTYTTLIVVGPVLLFAALSATATLKTSTVSRWLMDLPLAHQALATMLAVMPLLLVWLVFFLLYRFLPNAKVRAVPALIGALVGGSLWQALQWAYLTFQFGAASYNAIYGSFAQIPLLLLWLYLSWAIVLLGAQVSHTAQCFRQELAEAATARLTQADRHGLALLVVLVLARAAARRQSPPSLPVLAARLGLPPAPLETLAEMLTHAGLLVATAEPRTFVPLARPQDVSAAEVARLLDGNAAPTAPGDPAARVPLLRDLAEAADARSDSPTLADLLARHDQALAGLATTPIA